ncbi:PREDICTED: ribonuclease-like storage protein [Ipomoea nil]|uniref:ribonuclease-like storage protein n=1 Tax=Ipomoea nil TaxID=35883 RepID=UPI0009017A2B|nr:PREDICTED: ribonuclease-like storage protein [Ipomoea nil]
MRILLVVILLIFFGSIPKTYELPWDEFYLSLYWPPGYCFTAKNCYYHRVTETFTIQGFWPIDYADRSPPIPWNGHKYDHSLMYDELIVQLSTSWPDYQVNRLKEAFWADEWNKHGIISESLMSTMAAIFKNEDYVSP